MRRHLSPATAALAAVAAILAATPAAAQSASGLRTLTWPGRPAATPAPAPVPAPVLALTRAPAPTPQPVAVARAETRYSGAPAQSYPAAVAPRANGLTPASAFYAAPAPRYDATPAPYSAPTPQPQFQPQPQPAPQPVVQAATADPMAPRGDAAIFRMGSAVTDAPRPMPTQASAAPGPAPLAAPAQQGARYYSVHRAAGRQPDPTTLPAPFFLDMAPVDLAEPPAPPQQVRQGGLNPLVADGVDLP